MTPTLDHADSPTQGCACKPWTLCPECLGRLQRLRHDHQLQEWVEHWGNVERQTPKARPLLRVVR